MCVYSSLYFISSCLIIQTVKHVHWLHARAQKDRWHKEVLLVTYEMQWTVRYFMQKGNKSLDEANGPDVAPGPQAYTRRQGSWWTNLAYLANRLFKCTTIQYQSLL